MQLEPDKALKPGQSLCLDLIYSPSKRGLTPETTFKHYILAVDAYSRYPFLQGLLCTKAVDVIQAVKFICSQMLNYVGQTQIVLTKRIQADYGSVFTSEDFQKLCIDSNCRLTVAAPKHLEMNSIVERTWQSLNLIKNALIVHARVDETTSHFALLHAIEIFVRVTMRKLRKNGQLTTCYELLTGQKPKLNRFRVLFCPIIVKK